MHDLNQYNGNGNGNKGVSSIALLLCKVWSRLCDSWALGPFLVELPSISQGKSASHERDYLFTDHLIPFDRPAHVVTIVRRLDSILIKPKRQQTVFSSLRECKNCKHTTHHLLLQPL